MRTLLIDNYDSYTYNLFQLLAQISSAEPIVVPNDADWNGIDPDDYDNIVISPGPGHPGQPRDFGISMEALACATVPVLGVCLGHQGLALSLGGRVHPAPTPRHGHISRIRHQGDPLFADIPMEFDAVRYHSLAVAEPVPAELAVIAWAEDDVVMALRHRDLPRWGVQFHPESVETHYGRRLLRNFHDLTPARRRSGRRIAIRLPTRNSGATPPPRRYRARVLTLDHEVSTEWAFSELFSPASQSFWLDGARGTPEAARFSFLGDACGTLSEVVRYRVSDGVVRVTSTAGTTHYRESVFDYLQRELARREIDAPILPFDFTGGYVGYFGYELKADGGSANRHTSGYPDAAWLFADRFIAVDHLERCTYLVALAAEDAGTDDADRWLAETAAILTRAPAETAGVSVSDSVGPEQVRPWLAIDREEYLCDVAACQGYLRAGDSYEINLTSRAEIPATDSGLDTYRRLRRLNPAPYAAYLRTDAVEIACSSPERFLRIDAAGGVESKPIKGTAPRGATDAEDALLRSRLATDRKTRAENLMIVDLLRNDLGRVCEIGSVDVPVLMAVESYQTVHQLVSTVRGRLRADHDVIDCVRACFPGGSMTGAPKLRTCEIIESLERSARGVYSGSIGYLGCNGTADLNIVIRTMVLVGETWQIGAGGAIVLDSDPAAEYEELLLKAAAPIRALAMPTPVGS